MFSAFAFTTTTTTTTTTTQIPNEDTAAAVTNNIDAMLLLILRLQRKAWLFLCLLMITINLVTGTTATSVGQEEPFPLRIFLLVGQSNMEGKGSVEHLNQLLSHPLTQSTYQHYGTEGNYTQRDDVSIYFQDDDVYHGPLTVGYGMPINETFGPELEFGWIVGDAYQNENNHDMKHKDHNGGSGDDEKDDNISINHDNNNNNKHVLLIKCAWGGKSLAVDFRSPSSGVGNYTYCDEEGCHPYKPSDYGHYYRKTITTIQFVLNHLLPDRYAQYELAGLVWFQGWNDVINMQQVHEYGFNLAHWIRDVRADLNVPGLPIIVGELGQGGPVPGKDLPHGELRRQMRSVTELAEFRTSTRYVMTSPYVNAVGESFNGDYHYYGRADTFFYIGRAFGTAMIQLMETNPPIAQNISKMDTDISMSIK